VRSSINPILDRSAPVKAPRSVAEHLAFNQWLRDGRAVDGAKRLFGARVWAWIAGRPVPCRRRSLPMIRMEESSVRIGDDLAQLADRFASR